MAGWRAPCARICIPMVYSMPKGRLKLMRVGDLVISDAVLEKLAAKRGVVFEEVEEVCLYAALVEQVWRKGRDGAMRVFGRTFSGRYLFVVLVEEEDGAWRVVTARAMGDAERRAYRQQRGG